MKKSLLCLSLLASICVFAQDDPIFHWAKSVGAVGFDSAYDLISDASGNVYTVGSFNATVDFDPGSGTSNLTQAGSAPDGFIQKLDSQGNFVWAKRIGGNGGNGVFEIDFAANGDLILAGSFFGTVDFDPNAGTFNMTSIPLANPTFSSTDVFVVRLTADGNFVWAKKVGGNDYDEVMDMKVDANGAIFVSGFFQGTCDFDPGTSNFALTSSGPRDAYMLKLDPDGNFIWAKRFGGASETRINAFDLDSQGNILATGNFFGAIDVDPSAATVTLQPSPGDNFGQFSQDVLLLKLNPSGDYVWAGKIGGTMSEGCSAIGIGADDSVFISGIFAGNSDMDPGSGQTILATNGNGGAVFLIKYNSSGQLQWAKQTGTVFSPSVNNLQVTVSGKILTGGNYNGNFAFATGFDLPTIGNEDMFIARFDQSGTPEWVQSFGGSGEDVLQAFEYRESGIWNIAGSFNATVDFDPFSSVQNLTSNGGHDIFTLKLAPESLKTSDFSTNESWSVYPNPSSGNVNLHFDEVLFGSKVGIYTILGQTIAEFQIGQTEKNLNLKPGNYLIKIENQSTSNTKKLIVL
ncbi:T9SS type A sorting domain-containing protein [Flavobacterium sp.]|uniref:T9SS type A sorting domain-containing protein n=1 Tax=Flavobacterium sp. TaxID=239 RepID=UPI0025C3B914|nr:T9SS type A sorting domain-containing protein [Flavobacterium sp.]